MSARPRAADSMQRLTLDGSQLEELDRYSKTI